MSPLWSWRCRCWATGAGAEARGSAVSQTLSVAATRWSALHSCSLGSRATETIPEGEEVLVISQKTETCNPLP